MRGIPQTLPQPLSYYINRTMLSRNVISTNIFEKNYPHIFLISGMERYELSRFAKDKSTDNSCNQLRHGSITVRHMILDAPGHFERICKLTSDPVHCFRWEDGKLKWIQSRGGISAIHEFVDDETQDALNEEEFCKILKSNLNKGICISDSPGMGKSIFLAEVGRRLKELYPERTVIFLVFNEFINELKQIDFKSVLKSFLQPHDQAITIELLLDGFDEVDSANMQLAKELLHLIRVYCKNVRIWVTTRPHLLTELEVILETIGFNILPFSVDDQVQFLTKYWQGTKGLNQEGLLNFAYYCLRNLKLTVVQTLPISDIAGIPLQCLLLAEVYEEEAVDYATSDDPSCFPTMLINSVTDLYKSLIEKKFQKSGSIPPQTLMDMHAYLSLKSFFPERLLQFQHLFDFDDVDRPEMAKIGLLEGSNNQNGLLRFVHRTFAEYFVAWFVINYLQRNGRVDQVFSEFMLQDILLAIPWVGRYDQFVHPVIIYFIDSMMTNHPGDILPDINHQVDISLLDSGTVLQRLGNACAASNYLQILKFLIKNNAFGIHESSCFDESFLLFCIRDSCLDLVKVVLTQFELHHEFNAHLQGEALSVAIERGEFSIVEFLLKERQLHHLIENLTAETILLLHPCVECSWSPSEATLNGKVQIMQMLVDINPSLLEAKDKFGSTPLLHSKSHILLKLRLIGMGANIFARDNSDQTVLHLMDIFSREDYHDLVSAIPGDALRELVQVEDCWFRESARLRYSNTALSRLVSRFDPLPETLDKLREAGANFNYVCKYGYPILAEAIINRRNAETIRKLIECGANVRWTKGWKRKTLLHIAARWKNPEAVAVLLNYFDKDVRDLTLKTPMHYARKKGEEYVQCFELGLALANTRCESADH